MLVLLLMDKNASISLSKSTSVYKFLLFTGTPSCWCAKINPAASHLPFPDQSPGVTPEQSLGALVILTMVGGADRELILSNFDVLVSMGLKTNRDSSSFSLRLARQTCLALQKLVVVKKTKGAVSSAPFRLPEEHVLFQRLTDMMVQGESSRVMGM